MTQLIILAESVKRILQALNVAIRVTIGKKDKE